MSLTVRVLPVEEWPRLDGMLLASVWRNINPAYGEVIVVERDGEIVGSVALLSTLHAECIKNDGGPGVARLLFEALSERVRAAGGRAVWAASDGEPMRKLLTHHGDKIPGDHFLVKV